MNREISNKLVLLALFFSLFLGAGNVFALCATQAEPGDWRNYDPNTGGITRTLVEFYCQDQVLNGVVFPEFPFYISLWGKCSPTDCPWGRVGARKDPDGWIKTTIDHGFAKRYIWIKLYPTSTLTWLRVWIWTDFVDPGRTDYAMNNWMLR